jgi:hypothetical protein
MKHENKMNKASCKRITIILDNDLLKKLHEIQAKQIKQSSKSVSFSRVLNEVLRKGLT